MSITTGNIIFVGTFFATFENTADDTSWSFTRYEMAARKIEVSCFALTKVGTVSIRANIVAKACLTVDGEDREALTIRSAASMIG